MSNSKYALAMYDVRGKQEYIFKTNKLKEIVGGSCIIRDCFKEYLFPSAEEYMRRKAKKEGIPLWDPYHLAPDINRIPASVDQRLVYDFFYIFL